NDNSHGTVADLPGISATLTPDGSKVAYLRVNETDDVKQAALALDAATLTQQTRGALVNTLAWLIQRDSTIVVRDMASGHEIELPAPGLVKTGLRYEGDGRTLLFLGANPEDASRNDIYKVAEGDAAPSLAVDTGGFKSMPLVDPSGGALVYVIPNTNPLARPPEPGAGGRGGAGGGGRAGGAGQAGGPRAPMFAIVAVASRTASVVTGSAPSLSADGRTLAYVAR